MLNIILKNKEVLAIEMDDKGLEGFESWLASNRGSYEMVTPRLQDKETRQFKQLIFNVSLHKGHIESYSYTYTKSVVLGGN